MSLFVIDTDIFSLYEAGSPAVVRNIVRHANQRLAITVTTADEAISGWQASIRRARKDSQIVFAQLRLATTIELMAGWSILPMTLGAIARHHSLLRSKVPVKSNDLRIASVALEEGGIVVTRNARDFRRVTGLTVVDWSV